MADASPDAVQSDAVQFDAVHADGEAELREAERRLQAAQRTSDVAVLDALIDDRLVFTGPGGRLYSKQDDLELHRTGRQVLTRVDEEELLVVVDGTIGVSWFLGTLEGAIDGEPFEARVRYTRTWTRRPDGRWRLLAAHVSEASGN